MSEATLAELQRMAATEPVVVALVEAAAGSTPREAGAFMLVGAASVTGTIGGGEAERRTIEAARNLLARAAPTREALDLPLGPALDQCCGGHMRIALARIDAPLPPPYALWDGGPTLSDPAHAPVIVYGAGHVGTALVEALAPLPFALTWTDARDETLWPVSSAIPCRRIALPETLAAAAPDDACHIVLTHSHALDLEIVAAVLARPFRFLGLIGSATKRATFERRLRERGLDPAPLTSPIGLPEIEGKAPAVIAASVAAQLLALPPTAR